MKHITIDDLTYEDTVNIRVELRKYIESSGREMKYDDYVNVEIKHYNLGYPSVIKPKTEREPEQIDDIFEEVKDTVKAPSIERISNIGKKIYLESSVDGCHAVILVGTSEEADPDNGKISIYSDLGKLLHYVKEDDYIELKDNVIEVIKISSYTIPSSK